MDKSIQGKPSLVIRGRIAPGFQRPKQLLQKLATKKLVPTFNLASGFGVPASLWQVRLGLAAFPFFAVVKVARDFGNSAKNGGQFAVR